MISNQHLRSSSYPCLTVQKHSASASVTDPPLPPHRRHDKKKSCDGVCTERERERQRIKHTISTTAVLAAYPTTLHSGGRVLSSPPLLPHSCALLSCGAATRGGGGGWGWGAEDKERRMHKYRATNGFVHVGVSTCKCVHAGQ